MAKIWLIELGVKQFFFNLLFYKVIMKHQYYSISDY